MAKFKNKNATKRGYNNKKVLKFSFGWMSLIKNASKLQERFQNLKGTNG